MSREQAKYGAEQRAETLNPSSRDAYYRKRLDAILNTTADGIITIDTDAKIESFNRACESIFGYRADEVIGRNIKILMPEMYAGGHDGYLENYLRSSNRKVIGIGREVEAMRKDGSVFPIDLSIGEYEIDGARYFSGIVRDITARKRAEQKLVESNIELERFAYIASHDLQEPMRMVANFSELLELEYAASLDDNARQYIRFITGAARRMRSLVSDLLEYSRAGRENVEFQTFSAEEKVKIVLLDLQDVLAQKRARVTYDPLPMIHTNPMHFVRLVQNLIGNGVKYSRRDIAPAVHIGVREQAGEHEFCVADNGIGIAPEYLEDIFIIFKRLHKRSEYEGTGIGLSICKRIAECLGGRIWAESAPGEGSRFYFTIPKYQEPAREKPND